MNTRMIVAALIVFAGCSKAAPEGPAEEPKTATEPAQSGLAKLTVPNVTYSTAQPDLDKGKDVFAAKGCNGCHKIGGGKLVGPDLKGVTGRRDKEWIAKM